MRSVWNILEDQFVLVLEKGGLRAICMARRSLDVSVMQE